MSKRSVGAGPPPPPGGRSDRRMEFRWPVAFDGVIAALDAEAALVPGQTTQEHILRILASRYNIQRGLPPVHEGLWIPSAPANPPAAESPAATDGAATLADQWM